MRRAILIGLPLFALTIAFWLLVLGPKRQEASELEDQAAALATQVEEQEMAAAAAETARQDFPRAYRRLVVLGKATPADDDTSSLMVQLNRIADDAGIDFLALETNEQGGGGAPAPAAPSEPQTPAQAADSSEQQVANAEAGGSAPPPVGAPTEASAAGLPIGAAVGPAGLPVMKYTLGFEGDFFGIADFLAGVDGLVDTRGDGAVGVQGRLLTVDGFELVPVADPGPDPVLSAKLEVTAYLTPPDEGATAGADPAGPAPATEPQPVSGEAPAPPSEIASTTTP